MLNAKLKFLFPAKRHKVSAFSLQPSAYARSGFTLVEVMVVVVLLSLIILALMAVFNSTQLAFRASVTQAGVLEQGRATMDLIAGDLRAMAPSQGMTNGAVNFYAAVTTLAAPPSPLIQPMVGGNSVRTNVLESIFILSRGNENGAPTWYGVGYAVATNAPPGSLYSLYRFQSKTNLQSDPAGLFNAFYAAVNAGQWASMSHLMDGVVGLTVRAYNPAGYLMTNLYQFNGGQWATNQNAWFFPPFYGEVGFEMFSNTLPVSVQLEMGVLEDRALQRAESLSGSAPAQANYLAGRAGQVHVFRQRVSIPNADLSAFQ
jgi:prepilin-type N-terminal cleavage/methylation domain-containing protein